MVAWVAEAGVPNQTFAGVRPAGSLVDGTLLRRSRHKEFLPSQLGESLVKTNRRLLILVAAMVLRVASAQAITIPTVPIGNPGNPNDFAFGFNDAFGGVAYEYRIGKTEVTNDQYVAFLNAVAATDTYQLFSGSMTSAPEGGITRSGSPGSYTYAVKPPALNGTYIYGNKPVVYVSWYDAIRFANWLHNGQGGPGTTEHGAYTLSGGATPSNGNSVTRNPDAKWWLPSEDEWYKAAYHRNDGVTSNYWLYPTGFAPNNNPPSADTGQSATYFFTNGNIDPNFPLTDAGAYTLSDSAYGTFDQAGNVWEWNEAFFSDDSFGIRTLRGGAWNSQFATVMLSSNRISGLAQSGNGTFGFRVARLAIPEPSAGCLIALGTLGLLLRKRC